MATIKNQTIIDYLTGKRDYRKGVALYEQYGCNLMLKATFRRNDRSDLLEATLIEELRKLSGLSESEFARLKRDKTRTTPAAAAEAAATTAATTAPTGQPSPADEAAEKRIRFRKRFPFLSRPDCPEVLKILVSDMFTAHENYVAAHARLAAMDDNADPAQAEAVTWEVADNFLDNRLCMEELDYYRENGRLLGKHAKVKAFIKAGEVKTLDDISLVSYMKNARSNVSKWKKRVEQGGGDKAREALNDWTIKQVTAENEIFKRKEQLHNRNK